MTADLPGGFDALGDALWDARNTRRFSSVRAWSPVVWAASGGVP